MSEKENHAMYEPDLYAIQSAHRTTDPKPEYGRFGVQVDTVLFLCAATAIRP